MPEVGVLTIPFLHDSLDEVDFIVDTVIIPRVNQLAADKGLVALRWLELGPQNIFARKPILTPADAKSVRIRTTQDLATKLFLEAAQADVIYLPSPDVIPSLQTGLLDGGVTLVPQLQVLTLQREHFDSSINRERPNFSLRLLCVQCWWVSHHQQ